MAASYEMKARHWWYSASGIVSSISLTVIPSILAM